MWDENGNFVFDVDCHDKHSSTNSCEAPTHHNVRHGCHRSSHHHVHPVEGPCRLSSSRWGPTSSQSNQSCMLQQGVSDSSQQGNKATSSNSLHPQRFGQHQERIDTKCQANLALTKCNQKDEPGMQRTDKEQAALMVQQNASASCKHQGCKDTFQRSHGKLQQLAHVEEQTNLILTQQKREQEQEKEGNNVTLVQSSKCSRCIAISCTNCGKVVIHAMAKESLCASCHEELSKYAQEHIEPDSYLYGQWETRKFPLQLVSKIARLWPSICLFTPEVGRIAFKESLNRSRAINRLLVPPPKWMPKDLAEAIDTVNIVAWIQDHPPEMAIPNMSQPEKLGMALNKFNKLGTLCNDMGPVDGWLWDQQDAMDELQMYCVSLEKKKIAGRVSFTGKRSLQTELDVGIEQKRDSKRQKIVSSADCVDRGKGVGTEQNSVLDASASSTINPTPVERVWHENKVNDSDAFMERFLALRQYIERMRDLAPKSAKKPWKMKIHRSHICRDLLAYFRKAVRVNMYQPTKVTFIDKHGNKEEGNDESGLSVEMFMIFFRVIPGYGGLFERISGDASGSYLPTIDASHEDLFAFGRILCRCVLDDLPVSFELGPILLEILGDVHLRRSFKTAEASLATLSHYDPALSHSWGNLLNGAFDLAGITSDSFDDTATTAPVTRSNIGHWIIRGTQLRLETRRKESWLAIKEGFIRHLDLSIQLAPFATPELAYMIHGRDNVSTKDLIDAIFWPWESKVEEKKSGFKLKGCSDTPSLLKSLIEDQTIFNRRRRLEFLEWCTSLSVVSAFGIKKCIYLRLFVGAGEDKLPMTFTCTREIYLPAYESREHLQKKLFLALDHRKDGFYEK